MARRKRKKTSSGKKRTISPEQLAKMQEGRRKAMVQRRRIKEAEERGLLKEMPMTETERRLSNLKRG